MMNPLTDALTNEAQRLTQLPWLIVFVIGIPLLLIAWHYRAFPTFRWMIPLGISLALSVATIFRPELLWLTALTDLLLMLVVVIDLAWLLAYSADGITAVRSIPRTCSLGVATDSKLTIDNRSMLNLHGYVCDDTPEEFTSDPPSHRMDLKRFSRLTVERKLLPERRGAFKLENVYLRFVSPIKFWSRHLDLPVESQLNVYPDLKQLSDYALLARTDRLSQIGVRRTRRVGQDNNFERLRDYSRDDNYKHMDWRSTARRNKLTVRQFQTDQSQRVIFLLDCGRMMTNETGGYSLLDHSLNSMLMMSYVALAQGDSVGLLCFSDTIHSYIPPRGGGSQMNRLIQAGFDQFPRLVESRYDQAFYYLQSHCKRRSLVVLLSNVIDEVNGRALVDHLGNLSGRHLPMGVILRDRAIFDAVDRFDESQISGSDSMDSPKNTDSSNTDLGSKKSSAPVDIELCKAAAAADILIWRHRVLNDMQHKGVLVVDSFPDELTAPLVNQYLEIKAKHLL